MSASTTTRTDYQDADRLRVAIVELDGSSLYLRVENLSDIQDYVDFNADDAQQQAFKLTFTTMTRAEFQALGEFDGF